MSEKVPCLMGLFLPEVGVSFTLHLCSILSVRGLCWREGWWFSHSHLICYSFSRSTMQWCFYILKLLTWIWTSFSSYSWRTKGATQLESTLECHEGIHSAWTSNRLNSKNLWNFHKTFTTIAQVIPSLNFFAKIDQISQLKHKLLFHLRYWQRWPF